jgi:hypothetical protein
MLSNNHTGSVLVHFPQLFVLSSNMQLHLYSVPNRLLHFRSSQCRPHPILHKRIYLFRRTAYKTCWVQQLVKRWLDRVKIRVSTNTIDEVVLQSKILHLVSGLVRENLVKYQMSKQGNNERRGDVYSDLFVCFLPIATLLDYGHDDVFCRHERKFLGDTPGNDLGVHYESL